MEKSSEEGVDSPYNCSSPVVPPQDIMSNVMAPYLIVNLPETQPSSKDQL